MHAPQYATAAEREAPPDEPETDRLRGEVAALRAELDRITGEAERKEQEILSVFLEDVRDAAERLPLDGEPLLFLNFVAHWIARFTAEISTADEFAAALEIRQRGEGAPEMEEQED